MLRKTKDQNNLEWFARKEAQTVEESFSPVEEIKEIPADLAAQGLDDDMLSYYKESTESPEAAVEAMANLGIKFTESSSQAIKTLIVAGYGYDEEEEDDEPTDEELEEIESEETEEDIEMEDDDDIEASVKKITTKVAKKLGDSGFKVESTSLEREVRYSGSQTETNFGGSHRVAPGQFSMFEDFDVQVESMELDDNKERIQKSVEARKNSIKEMETERQEIMLASLREGLDLVQSHTVQTAASEPAVSQSYVGVGKDQISMFDGEGSAFASEKTTKEQSVEAAKKRKADISRKAEKDDSWKKVGKGTRSADKQAEIVDSLSKLFTDTTRNEPSESEEE